MNKQVIEAAIDAMQAELGDDLGWKPEGWRRVAESAIDAADLARAEDVKAAVEKLELAVQEPYNAHYGQDVNRARREVFKACGIPEAE